MLARRRCLGLDSPPMATTLLVCLLHAGVANAELTVTASAGKALLGDVASLAAGSPSLTTAGSNACVARLDMAFQEGQARFDQCATGSPWGASADALALPFPIRGCHLTTLAMTVPGRTDGRVIAVAASVA
jgi:hypothetical protein